MDREFRYTLWRAWDDGSWGLFEDQPSFKNYLMVIGLNPSTADETKDDPTIRRCIDFGKRWGFGGLCMTNLFGYRATDPKVMKRHHSPVGSENDHWLETVASHPHCGMVLAAWGNHGEHGGRNLRVLDLVSAHRDIYALSVTGEGHPGHPLYIPADTEPKLFFSNSITYLPA